ncbi:MAG: hypothetical protein IH591_06810 [Bacteroidales bacterium]|nr:hypothetical protein [Bacteroidales bacterium]
MIPTISINENYLAEYTSLLKYTIAWRDLNTEALKEIFDAKVEFDAPGIPYNIVGADKVIEAHKVFFDNLRDQNNRLRNINGLASSQSCYNVITQIFPYEHKSGFPFMQLCYFTNSKFLKLYYFYVDLLKNQKVIKRIKTHHEKFMVDSANFNDAVEQINTSYRVLGSSL